LLRSFIFKAATSSVRAMRGPVSTLQKSRLLNLRVAYLPPLSRLCLRIFQLSILLGLVRSISAQTLPFYLHSNDRVVFYGDSTTEQGRYTAFIEAYVATRFPELNVRFINSGWAGDWVVGGGGGKVDQRLARDVVAEKATVATFMLGMNDAAYQDFDPAFFDVYTKGYQHLLDSLKQSLPNLRITLLEPSPFDDVTRAPEYALRDGGYNKVIVRYGQFVRDLARQQHLDVVDMNAPLVAVLEKARLIDPVQAEKIIPDRIHPSAAGGLVMAAAILKAWNAPTIVSAAEIDASSARVKHQENTQITDLQKRPTLAWTQQDKSLPMPFDPKDEALALVLRSSNIVDSIDQQRVRVTGLPDEKYVLKIDGEEIGIWTSDKLARGVNLALLDTPMLKQALSVYAFTGRLHSLRMARWQGVQVALQDETSPHVGEAITALDAVELELLDQEKSAAVTRAHRYELIPQSSK
jgi:lysophospholipase L1-like esterase